MYSTVLKGRWTDGMYSVEGMLDGRDVQYSVEGTLDGRDVQC